MKAHRTDHLSLFFGLLFVMVAAAYVGYEALDLKLPEVGWFIAGGVIFLGVVMAATALAPDSKPKPQPEDLPVEEL